MSTKEEIQLYNAFENQLDRYAKILDKKEDIISNTTHKNMNLREQIIESKLNRLSHATAPKLMYIAMFVIALFFNPTLAGIMAIPVIAIATLSLSIKLIGNVHIVFTKIIITFIWLFTAIGALTYIISAITMICTIRGIYG